MEGKSKEAKAVTKAVGMYALELQQNMNKPYMKESESFEQYQSRMAMKRRYREFLEKNKNGQSKPAPESNQKQSDELL